MVGSPRAQHRYTFMLEPGLSAVIRNGQAACICLQIDIACSHYSLRLTAKVRKICILAGGPF